MQSCNSVLQKRVAVECISWRGHGNLGDDLIFAAQQAIFGDVFDLGQWRIAPEAVLVGGGTFVPKRLHHPELVELSRRLPTAFFGTGIGDPLFWGTDHIPDWLKVMRNARFIGVRGPLSMERLAAWGIATDQIEWIGDPGLYFAQKEIILHRCKGELAVNLGITYGKLYGFDEQKVEKTIIATLKQLVRTGWNVTLVCAWPSDDEVIERLQSAVAVSAVEHWHDDYGRALESVAKFDVVLSEKLHIGVVAACRGVPFVALNYRSKVMDFCRSIGWEQFCVSTENLDLGQVLELITTLAQARDAYSDRLQGAVLTVRERLLETVPRIVSALVGVG